MLNLFLAETTTPDASGTSSMLMLGVMVVFFVGMMIFSSRSNKKRQQKVADMIDSLKVGDKIKTIGGFLGTIVEICEDNAFIIETGSATMKSYMKIDKQAIHASPTVQTKASKGAETYDEVVEDDSTENK